MKMFLETHRYSKGVDLVNQLTVAVAISEKKKQGGKGVENYFFENPLGIIQY